jgi:hypothetical protein
MTLTDYASWASILSLPLSVVLWLFTRESAAKFWKEWFGWIFLGAIILVLFAAWHMGWLSWLAKPITWPMWGLILLGLGSFVLPLLCFGLIKLFSEQPIISQLDWHNYVDDEIFGVSWNWNYFGDKLGSELSAFCPRQDCKCRLKSELNNNARFNPSRYDFPISLICSRCGFRKDFDSDFESLKRDVFFEIERRLNTKEFLKRFENK